MKYVRTLFILLAATGFGCLDLSLGGDPPGSDTRVDDLPVGNSGEFTLGSIALHPRADIGIVLRGQTETVDSFGSVRVVHPSLFVLRPNDSHVSRPLSLEGEESPTISFPASGYLVFTTRNDHSVIRRVHLDSNEELMRADVAENYGAMRTSHSGRWIAATDIREGEGGTHVVDTNTLAIHAMPHPGKHMDYQWLHRRDALIGILYSNPTERERGTRILLWDLSNVATHDFELTDDGIWAHAEADVLIPAARVSARRLSLNDEDLALSSDDAHAAIPLAFHSDTGAFDEVDRIILWDVGSSSVRETPDATGPLAFLPDGSRFVAFHESAASLEGDAPPPALRIVDWESQTHVDAVGISPQFPAILPLDNRTVLLGSILGEVPLARFDLDTHRVTPFTGEMPSGVRQLLRREAANELWGCAGDLLRLDLGTNSSTVVPLDFRPVHSSILRDRRRLLLTSSDSLVRVFDADARRVVDTLVVGDGS